MRRLFHSAFITTFIVSLCAFAQETEELTADPAAREVMFSHERLQTDIYMHQSLARSILRDMVALRLAEECDSQFNSSLLWDTIDYIEFWDGTMEENKYRAHTTQGWGRCR